MALHFRKVKTPQPAHTRLEPTRTGCVWCLVPVVQFGTESSQSAKAESPPHCSAAMRTQTTFFLCRKRPSLKGFSPQTDWLINTPGSFFDPHMDAAGRKCSHSSGAGLESDQNGAWFPNTSAGDLPAEHDATAWHRLQRVTPSSMEQPVADIGFVILCRVVTLCSSWTFPRQSCPREGTTLLLNRESFVSIWDKASKKLGGKPGLLWLPD